MSTIDSAKLFNKQEFNTFYGLFNLMNSFMIPQWLEMNQEKYEGAKSFVDYYKSLSELERSTGVAYLNNENIDRNKMEKEAKQITSIEQFNEFVKQHKLMTYSELKEEADTIIGSYTMLESVMKNNLKTLQRKIEVIHDAKDTIFEA